MQGLKLLGLAAMTSWAVLSTGCSKTDTVQDMHTSTGADLSTKPGADLSVVPVDMRVIGGGDMAVGGGDMSATGGKLTVHVAPGGSLSYSPRNLTISVGDTVHWIFDSSNHTVTSGSQFGDPDLSYCSPDDKNCAAPVTSMAGATYDHKYTTAGVYYYFSNVNNEAFSDFVGCVAVGPGSMCQ